MKILSVFLIMLFLINVFGFTTPNPKDEYIARAYDDARVIRVKYTLGETFVKRSYDEGYEEANLNLPVFERDMVGTTDGRMELYLGRLNYVRLDYDTEVTFDRVPELRKTRTTIRIDRGGLYLFVNNLDYERDIQIQTPDCGVFILQNGKYRINVNTYSGSEVIVLQGMAQITGHYKGVNMGSGQRVAMFDGQQMSRPFSVLNLSRDDFGIWNLERDRMVDAYHGYRTRYLDPAYADYEYELSSAGNWRYEPTYSTYIWIPSNPGSSWKPYHSGRWIYHPYYGYVWTSYDRWGWFTHHYGRWHWNPSYGWYWLPGNRWSPAWVSWYYTDDYYAWCPLSRWNRPVIIINNRWVRDYMYRSGLPFQARSIIIVKRTNLWAPRIGTIALTRSALTRLKHRKLLFKGRHPKVRPKFSYVSIVNAKGKTVRYKRSAFLSTKKYKAVKTGAVYKYTRVKALKGNNKRINRYSTSKVRYKQRARPISKTSGKPVRQKYKPLAEKKVTAVKPVPPFIKAKVDKPQVIKKKTMASKPVLPSNTGVQKITEKSKPRKSTKKKVTKKSSKTKKKKKKE